MAFDIDVHPHMKTNGNTQIEWLKVVLALVAAGALVLTYILLFGTSTPRNHLIDLIINTIPSAIVVLGTFVVLYFLLYRVGIPPTSNAMIDPQELAEAIAARMNTAKAFDTGLLEFHQTFRTFDWKRQLLEAREHIDIVVYYYDSWVNANFNELVAFFQRPKTTMRIFVADPNIEAILVEIQRLFPEYSKELLSQKVMRTGERVADAAKNAGASPERVEFYLVPQLLSYSAQIIDGSKLVLSIFEMSRQLKIDSPAFVIDIGRNRQLADFVKKEIDGLLKIAKLV